MRSRRWYAQKLKYTKIIYELIPEKHIARITLNRPEKMNAMSHQLRAEMFHALKHTELNPDINVIIIKGAGRCFSSGYDLSGMGADEPDLGNQYVDTDGLTHWARYVVQQWFQIWDLAKVDGRLHKMLITAYERVHETVQEYQTDWRTAAYVVALTRLERTYKERGIFP